jgi:hypothetical protein
VNPEDSASFLVGILTWNLVGGARGRSTKEIRRESPPTDCDRVDWLAVAVEAERVTRSGERFVSDGEGLVGVIAPLRDGARDTGCD